jgi:hypothetical protein
VHEQYVWDLRYVDACVLRDRDSGSNSGTGNLGKTGSGLDERLYYLQDANFNVTALAQGTPSHRGIGKVVERFACNPYGRATVLDGAADADGAVSAWAADGDGVSDWAADGDGASDWDNRVLYCGYRPPPKLPWTRPRRAATLAGGFGT